MRRVTHRPALLKEFRQLPLASSSLSSGSSSYSESLCAARPKSGTLVFNEECAALIRWKWRWARWRCSGEALACRSGCHLNDKARYFDRSTDGSTGPNAAKPSSSRAGVLARRRSCDSFRDHPAIFALCEAKSSIIVFAYTSCSRCKSSAARTCSKSAEEHSDRFSNDAQWSPTNRSDSSSAALASKVRPSAMSDLARLWCNMATFASVGLDAIFTNSLPARSNEASASSCSPSLQRRFARFARAQKRRAGSFRTVSTRVHLRSVATSAGDRPPLSTASMRALHLEMRCRAIKARLCAAAAWSGVAPFNDWAAKFAFAPPRSKSLTTSSCPAAMAACSVGALLRDIASSKGSALSAKAVIGKNDTLGQSLVTLGQSLFAASSPCDPHALSALAPASIKTWHTRTWPARAHASSAAERTDSAASCKAPLREAACCESVCVWPTFSFPRPTDRATTPTSPAAANLIKAFASTAAKATAAFRAPLAASTARSGRGSATSPTFFFFFFFFFLPTAASSTAASSTVASSSSETSGASSCDGASSSAADSSETPPKASWHCLARSAIKNVAPRWRMPSVFMVVA
mmetsp:Transcript_26916/g.92906  ORF Transcript_26916/g.92906 Transcript_26916/m.92906 type:complete len:578 (-) Transcript_26916:258-1991(-)